MLLRLLLPILLTFAPGLDDEVLKEFKRYFKKYKDSPTRVEAILALEDTTDAGIPKALLPILKDPDGSVRRAAIRVLGKLKAEPQVTELLGALATESKPELKSGLLQAVELGTYSGAIPLVKPLLLDKEWEVRRDAISAWVALGPESAAEALLPLCEDAEVSVRCAAFDALAKLQAPGVLAPALGQLNADAWQLRASVIHALGEVRHRDSIGPLIQRMQVEQGRLIVDLGEALEKVTGRAFGPNLADWTRFWDRFEDRFEIPTEQELMQARAARAKSKAQYNPGDASTTAFGGVESPSRSILFVIDVSGSMEQEIADRERYEGGAYDDLSRMGIVKTELIRTVQGLEPFVKFNIISFATKVKPWKDDLVKANPLNKSSAESFVEKLVAIGGNSKTRLAGAGFTGSANMAAGKTNTYAAMLHALGVSGEKRRKLSHDGEVDTIFFLSDGRPSTGKYIEVSDILREIKRENELRRIVIHTLGIGDFEKGFMKQLAADNQGIFVDLGK